MNTRSIIARKEWQTITRDKIFILITALFLVMSVASVYIGASTKSMEMRVYDDIVQLAQQQGSTVPDPPQIYPLEILANLVDYIVMIGAVLAIFLGYRSLRAEHESGVWLVLRSRPLTYQDVIAGKLAGAAGIMAALLAATFLFNLLLFVVVAGITPTAGEMARLAVCLGFAFVYMLSFYIGALWVSWKASSGTFAFMVMLIIWIFVSFVIPQLSDTQRNFAYAVSSFSGTVAATATATPVSRVIDLFSPASQFTNLGNALLQADTQRAALGLPALLAQLTPTMAYLVGINAVLYIFLFRSANRKEALR